MMRGGGGRMDLHPHQTIRHLPYNNSVHGSRKRERSIGNEQDHLMPPHAHPR